jgi:hypothetical protein
VANLQRKTRTVSLFRPIRIHTLTGAVFQTRGFVHAWQVRGVPILSGSRMRLIAWTVCGVAITMSLASSCTSGHDRKVRLPTSSAPGTPPAPTPPAASGDPKGRVTAAYTGYTAAARKAVLAPADQVRPILAEYVAPGDYMEWEVRQVLLNQSDNKEPWGSPVIHVTAVDIEGSTAKLHDCQDASNYGAADRRTHQLIPGTRGAKRWNLVADMKMGSDGRWRVAGLRAAAGSCRPL